MAWAGQGHPGSPRSLGPRLTWLVEKAPEFKLHISLPLLQVLLLEAEGWGEEAVNTSAKCSSAGSAVMAEDGTDSRSPQTPVGSGQGSQDSHINELRLSPHQQMLLVDELEPVHQHVVLTSLWKPEPH